MNNDLIFLINFLYVNLSESTNTYSKKSIMLSKVPKDNKK